MKQSVTLTLDAKAGAHLDEIAAREQGSRSAMAELSCSVKQQRSSPSRKARARCS